MSWFGWLTKPRLEVTGLDELVRFFELAALIMAIAFVWGYLEVRKKNRSREKHGITCMCWDCK